MINKSHILTLLALPGIGRRCVAKILNSYSDNCTLSDPIDLRDVLAEAKKQIPRLNIPSRQDLDRAAHQAELIQQSAARLELQILGANSPDFPARLTNIADAPVLLFAKGNTRCLHNPQAVAVIGTRTPTPYGAKLAESVGWMLAEQKFVVVSGLAAGCDTAAHQGCVKAGGETVAFVAHGLDMIYPPENLELADNILASNGCLVSEYPPGTKPRSNTFVERDRLQSGLSSAVIVIETETDGGTMHTVRFALEQNRPIGCLVHPDEYSSYLTIQGNRKLIEEGKAHPIKDLVEVTGFIESQNPMRV